jgi:ABC-type sugar transport system permease subunit
MTVMARGKIKNNFSQSTKWTTVMAFLLPSLLGFTLFVLLPIVAAVGFSFTNYSGGMTLNFIGLRNYIMAFQSSDFLNSLLITFKFSIITVPLQLILGFIFAVILNQRLLGTKIYRSVIFVPTVLSLVAISLVFMLILHPNKGPVNHFLVSLGLPGVPWLTSPQMALYTIIMVTVWQSFGYYMVIFLGGLQSISEDLYEAATIDGANKFQQLFRITIPMLSPTTFFCIIMAIINSFKVFESIYVMTGGQGGGGPAGSTTVLVFEIYKRAFTNYEMGYASAEATILLLFILIITIIQYRGQSKWVTYDQ